MVQALESVFRYLDSLDGPVDIGRLTRLLEDSDIDCDDVRDQVIFSDYGYARNLMRAGKWYHALVLCWKNGQRSPIHDHAGSACGLKVLRGTMTETLFEFAPNGDIKATFSRDLVEGHVAGSLDMDMHQVSNLQADDKELVTLHIYSPPLLRMGTYSIVDRSRGEEHMLMEFCDAAGI